MTDRPGGEFSCSGASISVEKVSKRFGTVKALDRVDLKVEPGIVFALLGPNGSGKTTLVRVLTTLLRPDSGTASIGDYDVARQPDRVRASIGLAGQYPAVDENLTGIENLVMIARLYHLSKEEAKKRAGELLEIFNLSDAGGRIVKTYSGGMRRRLDLAAALTAKPPILFLDEPTTGLDPRSRLGLWDVISHQAKACNTVFLTTQYLEEADKLADRIAVIDGGRVIREGTPRELKECCGGGSRAKIVVADTTRTVQAAEILNDLGKGDIYSDPGTGQLSLPAEDAALLVEVVRRMSNAGIVLAEVGLKQPTLDDVFLSITGRTSQPGLNEDMPSNPKGGAK